MQYAICEISGRQYKVIPGKSFKVDYLGDVKNLLVEKVLLMVDGEKVEVGAPFLKQTLEFDVVSQIKEPKIRVAKFHAKANYRRVRGSRALKTELILKAKTKIEKAEVAEKPVKKTVKKEN